VSWIDYLGLFNQNAQQKCDFVIAGGHADDNWKRIDLGEDEEIGRLRCVGCHANRQNEVTGTTSQNGWQNNWLVRPEDYKLLKDDQDNRLYSDEDIENIRKDRKHRKVSDNDLLADEDTHKALKKELDSEANIAEKDGCRCCKKVTIKVECAQDFAVVELKILGSRSSKAICGTTWELDCKSKKWTKK
jgi:hypothetical protein